MKKLFSSKLALSFLGLLMALCHLCAAAEASATAGPADQTKQPATKPAVVGQKSEEQPATKAADEPANIVARTGDHVITREELEKRLMIEFYPDDYDDYGAKAEPPDAETVLLEMIAEKAMATEARKQGFLENELVHASIKRFKDRRLVNLLLQTHLRNNMDKVSVTESEVKQKMQADPKLDQARAKAMLERAKASKLLDQYYAEIYKKFHVKKLSGNFPLAVKIHHRLLYNPKTPRPLPFVRTSQIRDELTLEEKNIVLATYDHGHVTLKDWFETLSDFAPPSRPKDLNTTQGVERLLERALRMPLFISEAKLLGLDKDKDLLKQIREYEDRRLLGEARLAKHKEVTEPTTEQIVAYFNENKEKFRTGRTLKIDLIWCQDLEAARKVKAELNGGKDFESVKQEYSLEKALKAYNTGPGSEGLFWEDLSKGDPNEIVGPVKGFYREGIKWRIVKILEKKPGTVREYADNMENTVKDRMMNERRNAVLAEYSKELLKKYAYRIYTDRIKDIDPLDIP